MDTFLLLAAIAFMLIWSVGIGIGFTLRHKIGWFYILCGFLAGLLLGLTRSDLRAGIGMGIGAAIIGILAGSYMNWLKKRYKKVNEDLINRNKSRPH